MLTRWLHHHAGRASGGDAQATALAVGWVVSTSFGWATPFGSDIASGFAPWSCAPRAFIARRFAAPDLRAGEIARAAAISRAATLYRVWALLGGVAELV